MSESEKVFRTSTVNWGSGPSKVILMRRASNLDPIYLPRIGSTSSLALIPPKVAGRLNFSLILLSISSLSRTSLTDSISSIGSICSRLAPLYLGTLPTSRMAED